MRVNAWTLSAISRSRGSRVLVIFVSLWYTTATRRAVGPNVGVVKLSIVVVACRQVVRSGAVADRGVYKIDAGSPVPSHIGMTCRLVEGVTQLRVIPTITLLDCKTLSTHNGLGVARATFH
jgi:hypothetical protein